MKRVLPALLTAAVALATIWGATVLGSGPEPNEGIGPHPGGRPRGTSTLVCGATLLRGHSTERATLSFPTGGRLLARPVEIGSPVHRGDVIARLESGPHRHASSAQAAVVAELESRLAQMERDRLRTAHLVSLEAAARHDLEVAETGAAALLSRLEAARSQLAEARRSLGETTLRAPFDGMIAEVAAEPGELVGAGSPVVILVGDGGVEVEVEVPESLAGRLEQGAPAEIDLPLARIERAHGRVSQVGHSAGLPGRLFPVIVEIEGNGVLPGMTAEVSVSVPMEISLPTVPVAAIVDPVGGDARVFRVERDHVERVLVSVGDLIGDRVTIASHLEVGDEVVVGGHAGLAHGLLVEVRR